MMPTLWAKRDWQWLVLLPPVVAPSSEELDWSSSLAGAGSFLLVAPVADSEVTLTALHRSGEAAANFASISRGPPSVPKDFLTASASAI